MSQVTHDPKYEPVLDWLRAIAALMVCASHLRAVALVDWPLVADHSVFNKLLYALTGLGHQSVVVFFVISGYLVGGSVLSSEARFSWVSYLAARLSRLWVVVVPCLVLTFAADVLTLRIDPDVLNGMYASRWHSPPVAGAYSTSLLTLLGNVAFVQTIFVPVFGSNGPLWSLANEFWYYMLFPLLIGACGQCSVRSWMGRAASLIMAAFILSCWPSGIHGGFVIWLMGAWVSHVHKRSVLHLPRLSLALATVGMVGALAFSKAGAWGLSLLWGDMLLGAAVAVFLRCILSAKAVRSAPWTIRTLSNVSFSLYLSHFPLVLLAGACLFRAGSLQPSPNAWVWFAALMIALLAAAWSVWWLFEQRTAVVKQLLLRWIGLLRQEYVGR